MYLYRNLVFSIHVGSFLDLGTFELIAFQYFLANKVGSDLPPGLLQVALLAILPLTNHPG